MFGRKPIFLNLIRFILSKARDIIIKSILEPSPKKEKKK